MAAADAQVALARTQKRSMAAMEMAETTAAGLENQVAKTVCFECSYIVAVTGPTFSGHSAESCILTLARAAVFW
jgi:acetyl-CoA carboxylase beta subunit